MEDWEEEAAYVLYANHQSHLDALIIAGSLPLAALHHLLPLRFFTKNQLLRGVKGSLLGRLGCFPANKDSSQLSGLAYADALIETSCSLVIFPTGRRTRECSHVYRGIAVLAARPDVRLLPIYLHWRNRWSCELSIGASFRAGAERTPVELMERVYQLADGLAKK